MNKCEICSKEVTQKQMERGDGFLSRRGRSKGKHYHIVCLFDDDLIKRKKKEKKSHAKAD